MFVAVIFGLLFYDTCYYISFCSALSGHLLERDGTFELYHLKRCIDPNCHWSDMSNASGGYLSALRKNDFVHSALSERTHSCATSQTVLSNSFISTNGDVLGDINELNIDNFQRDSFL